MWYFKINVSDDLNIMKNNKKLFSEIIFSKFAFLEKKFILDIWLDFVFENKYVSVCINILKNIYTLWDMFFVYEIMFLHVFVSGTSTVTYLNFCIKFWYKI